MWFWDILVLLQTFCLAAAQVLATSLNSYYQLCIMLMIFFIGLTVLAHVSPFSEPISQHVQVSHGTALTKVHDLGFIDAIQLLKRRCCSC